MKQIIRHGAYGLLLRDAKILLTQKKIGPYKGCWGLPGGSIEYGETPEDTLKRELQEESSLKAGSLEFLSIVTATGEYADNGQPYGFHQVGLVYKVLDWTILPNLVSEEENRWILLSDINVGELTPFAKQIISQFPKDQRWRPVTRIRGKVIGLVKHESRLLVCEVPDDHGNLKGWCPLGGGIEFGETAQEAIKREMLEELGCGVQIKGVPIVFENIYDHHGHVGHEVVFAFPVEVDNAEIYAKKRFQIFENRGSLHWVEWIDIEDFRTGKATLYPEAILAHML